MDTSPDTTQSHLELASVSHWYGEVCAVDSVSLSVRPGSFFTLLGPSGCGKTTLLRLVSGFLDPDAGSIRIGGVDQAGIPADRRRVGMVFQDYALFPHMTVTANIAYGLRMHRVPRDERADRVHAVMQRLDIEDLRQRYPHELSGGQQQRVAVGRAVVLEPLLLLMDEPLSNLDAKLRVRIRAELKELQQRLGITTVYVTHDQEEALSLSDDIAVLDQGRLQQQSDPVTIYEKPVNPFVAGFVGSANMLRLTGQNGVRRLCMYRPEWLYVAPTGAKADDPNTEIRTGTVTAREYFGPTLRYRVALADDASPVYVDAPSRPRTGQRDTFAPGDNVALYIPTDGGWEIPDRG